MAVDKAAKAVGDAGNAAIKTGQNIVGTLVKFSPLIAAGLLSTVMLGVWIGGSETIAADAASGNVGLNTLFGGAWEGLTEGFNAVTGALPEAGKNLIPAPDSSLGFNPL